MAVVSLIAPLNNLIVNCACPIILDDNTEIHLIPVHFKSIFLEAQKYRFIRHPSNATHCILINNANASSEDGTDAKELIEEAVLRLRIHKEGGIYFDFGTIDECGWYYKPDKGSTTPLKHIGVFFYVSWERRGLPLTYELGQEDLAPLKILFKQTLGQSLLDRAPFRYFFRSYHEPYATDRFISNVIALENIFANDQDDKSNIKYKFVDRGCFILQQVKPYDKGAGGYAKPLSDIYDARSKLVHSTNVSKRDWDTEDEIQKLANSEKFLRMALAYVLSNRSMLESKKIDEAKRNKY